MTYDDGEVRTYGPDSIAMFKCYGARVATGSRDGKLRIINISNNERGAGIEREIQHASPVRCVAWDKEGKCVATGTRNGLVRVLQMRSGELEHVVHHRSAVRSVACDARCVRVAVGTELGRLRILNRHTGGVEHELSFGDTIRSISFDRDGQRVAVSGQTKEVHLIRVADARGGALGEAEVEHAVAHPDRVRCVAWALDAGDRRVVTGCLDGRARIIDAVSGEIRHEIDHGNRHVYGHVYGHVYRHG